MRERTPVFTIDPIAAAGRNIAEEALRWAAPQLGDRPILISATAPPRRSPQSKRRSAASAPGH